MDDEDDEEDDADECEPGSHSDSGAACNSTSADDVNCNMIVSDDYSDKTKMAMRQLTEKALSFELIEQLVRYVRSLNQPGAILIFLPGWNLISALLKHLRDHPLFGSNQYVLLPLHSQLAREEQYRVFEDVPPGKTKIIVSTNIAESSITINDIVFVIDCCKVKQKIFTSRNNMTNYATVWASKVSCKIKSCYLYKPSCLDTLSNKKIFCHI